MNICKKNIAGSSIGYFRRFLHLSLTASFFVSSSFSSTKLECATDADFQLYERLSRQTQQQINNLSAIGLEERAKWIKISWFQCTIDHEMDLTSFQKTTAIPSEVLEFMPSAKNTLITTDPNEPNNKQEDLQKILDVRLYPALRNLMKENKVEIFLGTKQEMAAYYKTKGSTVLFEFSIPSSATYYLVKTNKNELVVVMAGLVGRENMIAQLITMKLAGLNIEKVEIIGTVDHFGNRIQQDLYKLLQNIPDLSKGNKVLVVAGCGLEERAVSVITKEFSGNLDQPKVFKGDILSLTYIPLSAPKRDIQGFISLSQNYGEISEDIIRLLLENCHCKYVFTGGAGGYIPNDCCSQRPEIGSRIPIAKAMNEKGEVASLNDADHLGEKTENFHLQIPCIFLETYEWLEKAKQRGAGVDVETFYFIRAIQNYNIKHPADKVKADCGYFVSDYVGEKPLREFSQVYTTYDEVLSGFLQKLLRQ